MTFYFKIGSGIDQNAPLIANGVSVAHVDVAAQASAQQCIETAVHGDNVIALPRQLAKQIRARHHRRAANH